MSKNLTEPLTDELQTPLKSSKSFSSLIVAILVGLGSFFVGTVMEDIRTLKNEMKITNTTNSSQEQKILSLQQKIDDKDEKYLLSMEIMSETLKEMKDAMIKFQENLEEIKLQQISTKKEIEHLKDKK